MYVTTFEMILRCTSISVIAMIVASAGTGSGPSRARTAAGHSAPSARSTRAGPAASPRRRLPHGGHDLPGDRRTGDGDHRVADELHGRRRHPPTVVRPHGPGHRTATGSRLRHLDRVCLDALSHDEVVICE